MSSSPRICVSICSYDRYPLMGRAIESALSQSLDRSQYEIIVVDNSPDLEKATTWQKKYANTPGLTYLIERTPGLSNARNVSIRNAKAPTIIFLDDDAVATRNWLDEILLGFSLKEGRAPVGVVGGRIDPEWEAPRPEWLHDSLLGFVSVVNWGGDNPRVANKEEWFAGANIGFDVEALKKAGMFKTDLGRIGAGASLLSNEESDISSKIEALGYSRVYCHRASVDHLVPTNRLNLTYFRRRAAWQAASDLMMMGKVPWQGAQAWASISDFIAKLPTRDRTMRGLFLELEDPDLTKGQMDAVYNFTLLALSGFDGVKTHVDA